MCCRYTISHRYCANAGQGRFCPLFRYYNTKRLSCQYSGFAFRRTAVGAGVSDAGAISEERKRVRRGCAIRGVSAACPAWADVCDFGTVRTAWRLMLRRQVTCGGGIRIVRDAHGGLAHADCTRVWGVRWRMRGVREHGVGRICASVRSDALRDFPCIRMRPRFSGAVFG